MGDGRTFENVVRCAPCHQRLHAAHCHLPYDCSAGVEPIINECSG
jgi:hypothetical protein